jgi:hypothetical protein
MLHPFNLGRLYSTHPTRAMRRDTSKQIAATHVGIPGQYYSSDKKQVIEELTVSLTLNKL